jgi:hypothetical protein
MKNFFYFGMKKLYVLRYTRFNASYNKVGMELDERMKFATIYHRSPSMLLRTKIKNIVLGNPFKDRNPQRLFFIWVGFEWGCGDEIDGGWMGWVRQSGALCLRLSSR